MSLVHNERTKLTANAVSNLGLAFIVAGVIAPTVSFSLGSTMAANADIITTLTSFAWLLTGAVIHWLTSWLERSPAVTLLQAYLLFGVPAIGLLLALGAVWLVRREGGRERPRL